MLVLLVRIVLCALSGMFRAIRGLDQSKLYSLLMLLRFTDNKSVYNSPSNQQYNMRPVVTLLSYYALHSDAIRLCIYATLGGTPKFSAQFTSCMMPKLYATFGRDSDPILCYTIDNGRFMRRMLQPEAGLRQRTVVELRLLKYGYAAL